jgi:hypothetical protein
MFAGTSGIAFFATTGHMYSGPLRASEGAQGLWPCWKQRKNGKFLPISAIQIESGIATNPSQMIHTSTVLAVNLPQICPQKTRLLLQQK